VSKNSSQANKVDKAYEVQKVHVVRSVKEVSKVDKGCQVFQGDPVWTVVAVNVVLPVIRDLMVRLAMQVTLVIRVRMLKMEKKVKLVLKGSRNRLVSRLPGIPKLANRQTVQPVLNNFGPGFL